MDANTDNELADAWLSAPDPAAVTTAQYAIERMLRMDPFAHGQHVAEGLWRLHVPPLLVHYSIDPDPRTVEITQVDFAP